MPDALDLFGPGDSPVVPAAAESTTAFTGIDRDAARRRRSSRRRTRWIAAGVAVVVVAGGAVGYAATRGTGPRYRLADVTTGDVAQTVDATGTIASASRDDATFAVSGTVSGVSVTVGDKVTAGQALASLDTAPLQDAVQTAQDTLTSNQQTLADDLETQATGVATTSSTGSTSQSGNARQSAYQGTSGSATVTDAAYRAGTAQVVATAATATPSAHPSTGTTPDIAALQKAVTDAQQTLLTQYDTVTKALADAGTAISDGTTGSTATCAAFLTAARAAVTSTATTDPSASPTPSATPTPAPSDGSGSGDSSVAALQQKLDACESALGLVQTDQGAVQSAQQTLLADAKALDDAVAALSQALATSGGSGGQTGSGGSTGGTGQGRTGASGQGPSTGTGAAGGSGSTGGTGGRSGFQGSGSQGQGTQGSGSGGTNGTGRSGATGGTSGATTQRVTISAEQILADQAAIQEAQAELAVAQAQAGSATLTSRIAGTVAAVSVTPGSSVSTSTTAVTVLGTTGYVVDATVPLVQSELLKAGQTVSISVAGSSTKVSGTVSQIGVVNQSSTSTPSYTVSVAVDAKSGSFFDGASAQLAVSVSSAKDVMVVPTSAVTTTGRSHTVQVVDAHGTASTQRVEVGAVGPELTQVTSGLKVGQQVVLADLTKALPSSTSTTTGFGARQAGGFGGGAGGGFGGGFGGTGGTGRVVLRGAGG